MCGRGIHWLPPKRPGQTQRRCQPCERARTHPRHFQQHDGVAPEVVARFRAMWLDGSWRAYTSLVMDELIEGMAELLSDRSTGRT